VTSLAYEAFDYGEPVEIEIPAGDDVIDAPEDPRASDDDEPGD
jgi:hypothetical protein